MGPEHTGDDMRPSCEIDGPYIDAPDWPWSAAGWAFGMMFLLLFLLAALQR